MENTVKTVTMMDLRQHIGSIIDQVIYQKKEIIIKKHDKPVVVIKPYVPVQTEIINQAARNQAIDRLFGALRNSKGTAEEWIHAYDNVDAEYDARMKHIWE